MLHVLSFAVVQVRNVGAGCSLEEFRLGEVMRKASLLHGGVEIRCHADVELHRAAQPAPHTAVRGRQGPTLPSRPAAAGAARSLALWCPQELLKVDMVDG